MYRCKSLELSEYRAIWIEEEHAIAVDEVVFDSNIQNINYRVAEQNACNIYSIIENNVRIVPHPTQALSNIVYSHAAVQYKGLNQNFKNEINPQLSIMRNFF